MAIKFLLALLILIASAQLHSSAACNVSNCTDCISGNSSFCASCDSGYTLTNGQCYKNTTTTCNVNFCLKCVAGSTTMCESCMSFYKPTTLGTCTPISCFDSDCELCPINRNVCTRCKLGFWSDDGVCYSKCLNSMCAECKFNTIANENRCVSCYTAFTLNSTGGYCYLSLAPLANMLVWIIVGVVAFVVILAISIICICIKCCCAVVQAGTVLLVDQPNTQMSGMGVGTYGNQGMGMNVSVQGGYSG